jgi:hypothetical protein
VKGAVLMKFVVVSLLAFLALYGATTSVTKASQECYNLVNQTPGNVTIKFNYLNHVVSSVQLPPGQSFNVCFDPDTGAQAIVGNGFVWDHYHNGLLPMGSYPLAAPAGTYSLVPSTRYPIS